MALIAGAGNPTGGSNPSGTGGSINYIGNHAYGYSGTITYDDNFTAGLDHTTGNEYILGRVYWSFGEAGNDNVETQIFINDELIFANEALNLVASEPYATIYVDILIPSFSKIKVGCLNATDSTTHPANITFTGRTYA